MTTLPRFRFNQQPLDASSEAIGLLRSSNDALNDRGELHQRMALDGYLFLPGLLNRDQVQAARTSSLERLAEQDIFLPGHPLDEALLKPGVHMRSGGQEVTLDNLPLFDLLYSSHMIEFYEFFLGGPVRPLEYTWFRAKTPTQNSATKPHCDIVYMGRGTENLYTSWTPLGDVPYQAGGLLVLERSHLNEELKSTYGQTDVDVYCENEGEAAEIIGRAREANRELTREEKKTIRWTTDGVYSADPATVRNKLGGRWLTAEFQMGDVLIFSMYTLHCSHDNQTHHLRISADSRYQLVSEPIDPRWIGDKPAGNGIHAKRGTIC